MAEENFRIQFLRGTAAQNATFTGRDGELSIDTTAKSIRVHNGVTAGGQALAKVGDSYTKSESDGKYPLITTTYTKVQVDALVSAVSGGVSADASVIVKVLNWASNSYTLPAGVTVTKEYSDSSLKITHGKGKYPTNWFAFSRDGTPFVGIIPSATRNIQIVDLNNVIITNVSSFTTFDLVLNFV